MPLEPITSWLQTGQITQKSQFHHFASPPAAGQSNRSEVQLLNPLGSGKTLYVTRIKIHCTTDVSMGFPFGATVPNVTFFPPNPCQPGLPAGPASVAQCRFGATAGGSALFEYRRAPGDYNHVAVDMACYVLPPGSSLMLRPVANNTALTVSFEWWER